jgi:hypothetical protein
MTAWKCVLGCLHQATEAGFVAEKVVCRTYRSVEVTHELAVNLQETCLFRHFSTLFQRGLQSPVDPGDCLHDQFSPTFKVAIRFQPGLVFPYSNDLSFGILVALWLVLGEDIDATVCLGLEFARSVEIAKLFQCVSAVAFILSEQIFGKA